MFRRIDSDGCALLKKEMIKLVFVINKIQVRLLDYLCYVGKKAFFLCSPSIQLSCNICIVFFFFFSNLCIFFIYFFFFSSFYIFVFNAIN